MRNYTSVSRKHVLLIADDDALVGHSNVRYHPPGLDYNPDHKELVDKICFIQQNRYSVQEDEVSLLLEGKLSRWNVRHLSPAEVRQIREIRSFILRVNRCGEEGPVTCHVENMNTGECLSLINYAYMVDWIG
jgi:hypothetical protein